MVIVHLVDNPKKVFKEFESNYLTKTDHKACWSCIKFFQLHCLQITKMLMFVSGRKVLVENVFMCCVGSITNRTDILQNVGDMKISFQLTLQKNVLIQVLKRHRKTLIYQHVFFEILIQRNMFHQILYLYMNLQNFSISILVIQIWIINLILLRIRLRPLNPCPFYLYCVTN